MPDPTLDIPADANRKGVPIEEIPICSWCFRALDSAVRPDEFEKYRKGHQVCNDPSCLRALLRDLTCENDELASDNDRLTRICQQVGRLCGDLTEQVREYMDCFK